MDNALSDFLADAMHLCDLHKLQDSDGNEQEFDTELERGQRHFRAELAEARGQDGDAAYQDEDEGGPIECSEDGCKEMVSANDPYYSSPCGTFCESCMTEKHAEACEICRNEFDLANGSDLEVEP